MRSDPNWPFWVALAIVGLVANYYAGVTGMPQQHWIFCEKLQLCN